MVGDEKLQNQWFFKFYSFGDAPSEDFEAPEGSKSGFRGFGALLGGVSTSFFLCPPQKSQICG